MNSVDPKKFVSELSNGPKEIELNGEKTEIKEEYILINIKSKEGFDVTMENNLFVILDTELSEELINEGYIREFISKNSTNEKELRFKYLRQHQD